MSFSFTDEEQGKDAGSPITNVEDDRRREASLSSLGVQAARLHEGLV